MRKKIKIIKKIFKLFIVFFFLFCSSFVCHFYFTTKNDHLNFELLEETKTANSLLFYDNNGKILPNFENKHIKITKLSSDTINAFICAEDKRFFHHNGIDVIRIVGAIKNNLQTKSFSQGGSTISQQLIKNIQLSNEKTINRKLKEIKLTLELEKKYSKNEILEMYLNSIYFGSGCYGIENASNYYFGKSASCLNLAESALLAGTINAPSYYDIQNNFERANKRKDLILTLMKNNNYISNNEFSKAKSFKINLNIDSSNTYKYTSENIIDEASTILNLSESQLNNSDCKILTSINNQLQSNINKIVNGYINKVGKENQISTIVLDNKTNNIISTTGKLNIYKTKIQPGSAIKPILVYAPAIEYNIVSPATKILDEEININGYSPANADKNFHGYVSVRESLKNSYNIPAVKLLNEIGIEKAQKFANKLGIKFNKKDKNLATALGAMTDGISLKSLADAYMCFANGGKYEKSSCISKIIKGNKIIFEKKNNPRQVMENSSAFIITDMLVETAKNGTAKRLATLPYEVASKTGTVGKANSSDNIAALNLCYTTKHTVLVYIGGSCLPSSINGASYPTMIAKEILEILYKDHKPDNFTKPDSVKNIKISKTKYENNIIAKTDEDKDMINEIFKEINIPNYNETLSKTLTISNEKNSKPIIQFYLANNYKYKLIRKNNRKKETILTKDGKTNEYIVFKEKTAKSGQIYEYFVEIYDLNENFIAESNHVTIKSY